MARSRQLAAETQAFTPQISQLQLGKPRFYQKPAGKSRIDFAHHQRHGAEIGVCLDEGEAAKKDQVDLVLTEQSDRIIIIGSLCRCQGTEFSTLEW